VCTLFFTYTFTENYESKHLPICVREPAHKLFKQRRRQNFCHPHCTLDECKGIVLALHVLKLKGQGVCPSKQHMKCHDLNAFAIP
jgi:hypothetical protein